MAAPAEPGAAAPPMTPTRRATIAGALALAGCASTGGAAPAFVTANADGFRVGGRPYRFVGANIWYGAYLGADAPYGDRDRLRRELDALAAMGVTNLRVLASSEASPLKGAVSPTFRTSGPVYNEQLLGGLDYMMAELGRRGQRAVLYLTNFWEWSGGMMAHLYWTNGGRYLDMNDPARPWPAFPDFIACFYGSEAAVVLYHDYVRALVGRTNRVTGRRYAEDPTIMAWQLANEPRPGGSDAVAAPNLPAFHGWIRATARLIKSIDPNHLVSTGSEGLKGCIEREACVMDAHAGPEIDYLTAHIWPLNWSWIDAKDLSGTYAKGEALVADYIDRHTGFAQSLGKPLVIEEFGYPRDGGVYDPSAPTSFRDRFYRQIYDAVLRSAQSGGPLTASNFWAWGGEGRTRRPDRRWREGDPFLGDPPHEPQGWYSVFDTDASTQALIEGHAQALAAL